MGRLLGLEVDDAALVAQPCDGFVRKSGDEKNAVNWRLAVFHVGTPTPPNESVL